MASDTIEDEGSPEAEAAPWGDDAEFEDESEVVELDNDIDEDALVEDELEDDELADEDLGDEEIADDADIDDDDGDGDEEALDELEAEELEMLTDDEESEALIVDEAAEMRAIRRAELAMDSDGGGERAEDEFLCQSCFLVLKRSQLANARKMWCRDCAA